MGHQREFNSYLLGEPASASRSWSGPATSKSTPTRHAERGRSPRRPARSSCIRPCSRSSGSIRCRPTAAPNRTRLPERIAKPIPLDARHGRSRKELPPLAVPRPGLGAERSRPTRGLPCTPRRRAPWGSTTAPGCISKWRAASGACRLRIKLSDATPPNVVNTGMGWWPPSGASARARRPRHQYQRGARLERTLGSHLRVQRHSRLGLPGHRDRSLDRKKAPRAARRLLAVDLSPAIKP